MVTTLHLLTCMNRFTGLEPNMPYYDVTVYVAVQAENEMQAYAYIKHALDTARKQEVNYLDAEVTNETPDSPEDK